MLTRCDYYVFGRLEHRQSDLSDAGPWDFLLSAYDESERVEVPFDNLKATEKQWVVHEEYGIEPERWPKGAFRLSSSFDPPDVLDLVDAKKDILRNGKICIDATGFIRPHLLVLLRALIDIGTRSFDVIYSDPVRYVENEDTEFAGPVVAVKQVLGYEGIHTATTTNDILVIGAGYDYEQITRACEEKLSSKKYILTGLPSLQPHMYQESVLRIERAAEAIGNLTPQQQLHAPANNPFAVAQVLQDLVKQQSIGPYGNKDPNQNLYLCPVGPKPHVLGFALFYLREMRDSPVSVIYPFAKDYRRMTTDGILRTWQYQFEI